MPTYGYTCTACKHAFEKMQGIKARKLRKCPRCGKSALKREITGGGGFILRGPGFYCNDYPKEKKDKNNS